MRHTHVLTEALVDLPVENVWEVVADDAVYATWNKLFWFDDGPFVEGEKVELEIALGPFTTEVDVTVEVFRPQEEFRWVASLGPFRGSHFIKVAQVAENRTQILHGEDFQGLGLIWPHVRDGVRESYQSVTDALVRYLESLED